MERIKGKVHILYAVCTFLVVIFGSNNLNSQLSDWFKIYADDEANVARFDHINFSINYDTWQHDISDINTEPYSFGFDLGIYKDVPISKRGNITLGIGLNYGVVRVHHNADIVYSVDSLSGERATSLFKSSDSYTRNRLFTSYLDLPIEFRFRKLGNNKIRFYAGFKGGVLLSVNNMRAGNGEKFKVYRIKNTNLFRYGPTLKFGYGNINFYGFYSMAPLFDNDVSSQISPLTFGLTFFVL